MKPRRPTFHACIRGNASMVELVGGNHFHLDTESLQAYFGVALTPRMYDLLRIASSVYVADRITKRVRNGSSVGWCRQIEIELDVFDSAFWADSATTALLVDSLGFLTGDDWTFVFRRDPVSPPTLREPHLPFERPNHVCLYSGGLDSAAGLAALLPQVRQEQIVPVLVRHQSGQRCLVAEQLNRLGQHFHVRLAPLVVRFASLRPTRIGPEENTQRSRSFLFCAAGGAAASLARSDIVDMLESGIGAINVPLMAGMVGGKATRSSHPHFLRLMSSLVSMVAGRQIEFRLPHMDKTKAEVVARLAATGLHDIAVATASCVHYPLREKRHKQCGVCPACIFRRQALVAAGIEELPGTYKYDLFGPTASANCIPSDKLRYVRAFLMQVEKLSSLQVGLNAPQFLRRHLFGTHVVTTDSEFRACVELYRRHVCEWVRVVGQANGRTWAAIFGKSAAA